MKTSLLFTLFSILSIGICSAETFISFNVCNINNGKEVKQSIEILADNCASATSLPDIGTFDNTGNTPTVGNFDFIPEFTAPNVYYFELTAADFGSGQDRIRVTITPTGAPAISNYEVWIMGNCDGTTGLIATDITNICFEISPLTGLNTYKIAVVSEAADAGMFTIEADLTNAPTLTLASDETSGVADDDDVVCEGDDFDLVATNDPQYTYVWEKDGTPLTTTGPTHFETNVTIARAGTYSVTITDNDGCTEEASVTMTVNPLPIVNLTVAETSGIANNDGDVCEDDNFVLTATPGGTFYSWTLDGNPIAGATNILTVNNATAANEGNYEVTYTDVNGCENTDDIDITIFSLPVANNTELEVCADGGSPGEFTLEDAELTPGFPNTNSNSGDDVDDGAANMTVTYHASLANAQNGTGALSSPFIAPNNTTIFARVESNITGCFSTATVLLTVHINPTNVEIQNVNNANSPADFTVCEQDQISITANEGVNGTAPYTYDWEAPNGATFTTETVTIASANPAIHDGVWNLTVTDVNGCTGTDDITITVTANPSNDDCGNSIVVNSGANPNLSNECATEDLTVCGAQSEASVWYEYTVGNDEDNIVFSTTGLTNSVVQVYDGCGGTLVADADGNTCNGSAELECIPEGTVLQVFVSSSSINTSANFTLTITPTSNGVANDECDAGVVIPDNPTCEFFAVASSNTTNACPEQFTVAACALNYSTTEIVWYEFTTPAGTGTIELDNITANAFLTIFEDCPATSIVAGGGCISGGTTTPITVSENTTYYVAIGINGAPGAVGFEIKYNLTLDNDDACGPGFIPTPVTGTLTNQDNTCATDDNDCGTNPVENTLWYTFVLSAPNNVITINVTGLTSPSIGLYDTANPCNATPVDEECEGDGEKEFTCLQPGTYTIMVGTSAANAGVFSITATESQNSTVANDICTNATPITIGPNDLCIVLGPFSATNEGACPEDIAGAADPCDFNTEETSWYSFVAPGMAGDQPTMDFEFTSYSGTGTPFMGVFTGSDCSNLNTVEGCNSGLTNFSNLGPFTPGDTYLIGISSSDDDGGDFEFEVKFNLGPPNDDPCADLSGYDLTGGGTTLGTTSCAGGDLVVSGCPPADQENDVFYQFTIPDGVSGVTVEVQPIGADGYTGNVVLSVIEADCNGGTEFESACGFERLSNNFDCLPPGDYFLLVATPNGTSGDFTLTLTEIPDNGPANDICDDAEPLALTACEWEPVAGTTIQACFENFNAGGCMFSEDPTVFYEFTTPPGATVLSIRDISTDSYVSIITACTNGSFLACSEDGPIDNIVVAENTTYYLAVGSNNMFGLDFDFEIKISVPPSNDCITPEVISGGGSATLTNTCCATYSIDNGSCPAGNQESTVWFEYQPTPGVKAITVSFSPGTISGPVAVEAFTGAPGQGCNAAMTAAGDPFCILAGPYEVVIKCEDWTTTSIYVKVGSTEAGCGTFSLDFTEESGCEGPETCADITDIMLPQTDGAAECVTSCNEFNCSEGGDCDPEGASTWFAFTTDGLSSSAVINVTAPFDPITTISFGPDCASAGTILACGDAISTIAVQPGTTYYIKVEAADGENLGDFQVCVVVLSAAYPCYPNSAITQVTRPEYPLGDPEGPYCPGETVNFCIHIDFVVAAAPAPDGNNCQWIQGIIPSLGYAWDYLGSSLDVQGPGGNWFWLDQDIVDYNVPSSIYSIGTHPDGVKYLNYLGSSTGLAAGTLLPGGWWVTSNGSGALCTNDLSDPDTAWGDPFSCNGNQIYDFCLDLKVKEFPELENCTITDLGFTLSVMADGETGCWSQISCALSEPVTFDALVDCTSNILVSGDPVEICNEGDADIVVFASEPGSIIELNTIDNPNVLGETLTGSFPNSAASFTDHLVNIGSSVEVVQYVFYARSETSICKGPDFILEVTIYPQLLVQFPPTYVCEGLCTELIPVIEGGTGNYVDYDWSTGANTPTITVCPLADTEYGVTVTDDLGCTGEGVVLVEWKEAVTGELDPDPTFACQDGVEDIGPYVIVNIATGQDPYQITWDMPFGVYGLPTTTNHPDDTYEFEEEASTPSAFPYDICVNVVDVWGCEADICGELVIDGAADVTFTHAPLVCGQNSTVLTANFDFGNSSSGLDHFELYDCEGNLIATSNNDPSTFPIADITANNCFIITTITEAGCVTTKTLNINPPTGIQPVVTAVSPICEGFNSLLNVANSAAYTSIQWSTMASGPSTIVSPSTTTNYSVTVTEANGCTATKVVTVVVNPLPEITILGSLSFCTGFSTTIEANAGPGINYQWWDSSPAVVSDTSVLTVSAGGNYTVSVTSGGSCVVDSTITILESTSLQVSMSNIDLCDNAVDTLTPGNFFVSYAWTKDGLPLAETSSKLPVTDAGNYCVSVSDGNCSGIGCVDVINNNSPIANVLIPFSEVCRINSGVGPTSIDFTTLVSGANGTWIDSDFTGVDLSDLTNVSFIDIPRDTYTFTFITNTAITPCENDTVAVDIFVRNCFCPTIAFQPIVLCNDETNAVNLNQYLNVPDVIRPGIWTVTGGPASIPVSNDSLININNVAGGIYQLAWQTTTVLGPACQTDSTHVMTINDAPDAGVKGNRFVCNTTNPLGPTSIDLDSVLVAGTSAGAWIQTSGTTVTLDGNNIFDATGMSPGVLQFTYNTTAATPPCDETFVVLTVDIRDCNCPIITIANDTLCNGSDVVDLNTLLTIQPSILPGTWTTNAPGSPITGSNFNATGITSGAYSITYTLNTSPGLGCDVDESASVVIRRQPTVTVVSEGSPCNANTGNGITTVNLNSLITGTQNGIWTQVTGTPVLTIPANGIVDFSGQTIGSVFEFRYDLTAVAPCTPATATVRVVVRDCDCPNVDLLTPPVLCNSELSFDLSTLEGPIIATGVWTVLDPVNNPVTVAADKTFVLDNTLFGTYKLRYTLDPAPSGTCPKFNEVQMKVEKDNTAVIPASSTVCTINLGNNDNVIDFRSFYQGNSYGGGTWENTDNAPVNFSDITKVNFSGAVVGQTYTFTYRINNLDPCPDHSYTIEIEVIDCTCPPIKPGDPVDVCTVDGTVALSPTYDDPNNPGKWESTQITIDANGVADISNLASGNYIISYVIDNPLPSCPDSEDRTLTVIKVKNAGTTSSLDICSNEPQSVRLVDLLTGEDTGGSWKEVSIKPSIGGAFNANLGTFNTNNQAASSYVFEYGFSNQNPCPDVKQTVTVNVISAPTAQAGDPATLNCVVAEVTLGDPTDNQPNVTYQWSHDGGVEVPNADKATTKVNFGGEFTIVVTDIVTGCKTTDDVIITVDPNKPVAQFDTKDVTCFQQRNGSISFINVTGGQAPLQYSNNGGTTFQASPNFINLNGGIYTMVIKDATGCVFTETIEITEPPLLSINLGNDIIITKGESDTLSLIGQLPANLKSIEWTATDTSGMKIICNLPPEQCFEIIYKPDISTTICATIEDENGCVAEDCKVLNLIKARNIIFSNILQPGNGGENKFFYVESESIAWVNEMRVYDRWGNLMFERNDFLSNQPDLGWNGKFNGKEVVPGVYTWVVEVEYDSKGSGDVEVFVGDVTVIR